MAKTPKKLKKGQYASVARRRVEKKAMEKQGKTAGKNVFGNKKPQGRY